MDEDILYRHIILDLYKNPQNRGQLSDASISQCANNPSCGDRICVSLVFSKLGIVEKISWDGGGCAISEAAASLISEEAKGKSAEEILLFDDRTMYNLFGFDVISTRQKCALLALSVLKRSVETYLKNKI